MPILPRILLVILSSFFSNGSREIYIALSKRKVPNLWRIVLNISHLGIWWTILASAILDFGVFACEIT